MKTAIDDWHFRAPEEGVLLADVYLANGQHAVLEVNPLINPKQAGEPVPEIIVFCEMPGERITGGCGPGRWVSRPPHRSCPWSSVEIPSALERQIHDRLQLILGAVQHSPGVGAETLGSAAHASATHSELPSAA